MTGRRHHLPAFFAFTALWYLRPTGALWILYLLHTGWSLWQVGVAEAGWHVVALLSDLPTGAFADRHGRRLSMAIGVAIGTVQPIAAYLTAPVSVPWGTAAVALGALGYTFVGGADRALLYGIACASPAGPGGYGRLYGRVLQASYLAEAVGAALGGLLATDLGWAWPYGVTAASQLFALAALAALPAALPVAASGAGARPRSLFGALADAVSALRARPPLLRLVAFGGIFLLATALTSLYAQSTLALKGASVALATRLIAASGLCAAIGSAVGGRLAQRGAGRATLRLGAAGLGALVALIGVLPLAGSAAAFLAAKAGDGLVDPVYEARLNRDTPEAVRATVLSAPGTGFSLAMILVFPLAGLAMTAGRLAQAYAAVAALLALSAIALLCGPERSHPCAEDDGAGELSSRDHGRGLVGSGSNPSGDG